MPPRACSIQILPRSKQCNIRIGASILGYKVIPPEVAIAGRLLTFVSPSLEHSPLYTATRQIDELDAEPDFQLAYCPLAYRVITRVSYQPRDNSQDYIYKSAVLVGL
jgi:hypothetical protein